MPENNLDKLNLPELWIFIIVVLSGAVGGCAGAFTNRSHERKLITFLIVMGYVFTGVFGALVAFTFMSSFGSSSTTIESIVLWSCLTGFSTSIALAGTNLGFKIVLKKLGIELEITVRRNKSPIKEIKE